MVPDEELAGLCLWNEGHPPPAPCVEVVSARHPSKGYEDIPARCAAAGVMEPWVLDPRLVGSRAPSGPHRVQVFARQGDGTLLRVQAGDGAGWSPVLRAYKERALAENDLAPRLAAAERAIGEEALARLAELDAEVRRRG